MKPGTNDKRAAVEQAGLATSPQQVLFAETPKGHTIGVVSDTPSSPLSLLAAGVAGMAARRVFRERTKPASTAVSPASKPTNVTEVN